MPYSLRLFRHSSRRLGRRRFLRAEEGSAVVEFAFLAPALIMFMLASVVSFDAVRALRQMSTAASTVSDLATRIAEMDDSTRDAIFVTAEALLGHYAEHNPYNITITSVANELGDGEDTLEVVWSESKTSGSEVTNASLSGYDLPEIPDGESIIMVEVDVQYDAAFAFRGYAPTFDFEDISIRRPRFVTEVCYRESESEQTCSHNNDDPLGGGDVSPPDEEDDTA
ncbi:MAG: hypothetical protein AAF224_10420 [Pseudomonadota bacterium]